MSEGRSVTQDTAELKAAESEVRKAEIALTYDEEQYAAADAERLKQLVKLETEVEALANLRSVA